MTSRLAILISFLLIQGVLACKSDLPVARKETPAIVKKIIPKVITEDLIVKSKFPDETSQKCQSCHLEQFTDWSHSQHAVANRLVTKETDLKPFSTDQVREYGKLKTSFETETEHLIIKQTDPDNKSQIYYPEAVIGITPEIQYLIPFPDGRLQVFDEAYDPHKNEWFNVFGSEVRDPKEWGSWQNRGNNWNSQCAYCHMSDYKKNYSVETDTYKSTWAAMGVNCSQCHGDPTDHLKDPKTSLSTKENTPTLTMDNCAACHSRREELTADFKAGEKFVDHYRLMLADDPLYYHPDGQQNDEVFVYGSFMNSRMGHKGITCQDCHNPHSGKLIIPTEKNALCLSCHASPGRKDAVIIDPLTHSHHDDNSGNSCVECHMPEKTYMQRDPRRDHYFGIPDPLLSKELNTPNACAKCHADQDLDWAIKWTDKWYGKKMDRPTRTRARVIARAQQGDQTVIPELLKLAKTEEIAFWRATLTALLRPWANESKEITDFLKTKLKDSDPTVRAIAVQALEPIPEMLTDIEPLKKDSSRLVRLDAVFALPKTERQDSPAYQELLAYLDNQSDQPAGLLKRAQLKMKEGENLEAEQLLKKIIEWDTSAVNYHFLAQFYYSNGKSQDAIRNYQQAIKMDPNNFEYTYNLSLLYAENAMLTEAVRMLEKTVELNINFGRAWYNLGLAYSEQGKIDSAIKSLILAEKSLPTSAEVPYALATIYLNKSDFTNAERATLKSLEIDSSYLPARELLDHLNSYRAK